MRVFHYDLLIYGHEDAEMGKQKFDEVTLQYSIKSIHDIVLLIFLPSDGILDSIDCLHIMLTTIQPSWLKMCVSEILLQDYDDCLVLSQYKTKAKESLSLEKLVS